MDLNSQGLIGGLPTCPKCRSGMYLRMAKVGVHTGQMFWGCGKFPKCKGILTYREGQYTVLVKTCKARIHPTQATTGQPSFAELAAKRKKDAW